MARRKEIRGVDNLSEEPNEFEEANSDRRVSILAEFFYFLREEKKWWLAPIIIVLLAIGALLFLSASGAAPFIYSLF